MQWVFLVTAVGLSSVVEGSWPTHSGIVRYHCSDLCCSSLCREDGTGEDLKACVDALLDAGQMQCRLRVWQQFTVYHQNMQVKLPGIRECSRYTVLPDAPRNISTWRPAYTFAFEADLNSNRFPEDLHYPPVAIDGYAIVYNVKARPEWKQFVYLGQLTSDVRVDVGHLDLRIDQEMWEHMVQDIRKLQGWTTGIWPLPIKDSHFPAFGMIGTRTLDDTNDLMTMCEDYEPDNPSVIARYPYIHPGWLYNGKRNLMSNITHTEKSYVHIMGSFWMDAYDLKEEAIEPDTVALEILREHGSKLPSI